MRRRLVTLLATAAIVGSACAGTSSTTPPAGQSTPPAQTPAPTPSTSTSGVDLVEKAYQPTPATNTGGTIVLSESQFPDGLVGYYTQAVTSWEAIYPAFDGLTRIANDFKWYPDLAKTVPLTSNGGVVVNGDKMDVKWELKDGMKWSNGDPINCDDVIATWKWIMDPAQAGLVGGVIGWEDIGSIDGAGTTTCTVHFNKIYEGYLGLMDPILPAKYLAKYSVADAAKKLYPMANPTDGVYSGPYIPTEIRTDAQITYAANPNWQTISGHAPYLDKVIFKYYGDIDAQIAGYKANEYDVGFGFSQGEMPSLQGLDKVVSLDALQYELNELNNKTLTEKFGADSLGAIKQAIALSYNKSEITDRILGGVVQPSYNYLSPLLWYYKDEPKTAQDFAKANELLDAAGWTTKGSDGIRTKDVNGKTVKLELLGCTTTKTSRVDTLKLVASWLKNIGIQLDVSPVPASPDFFGSWNETTPTTKCNTTRGNFDLAEFAWSYSPDPLNSYNVYHSSGIPENNPNHSGQNTTRVSIPALDAAFDKLKTTVDPDQMKQVMYEIQDIYTQNQVEIPLFNWKEAWLVNPKLENIAMNPTQYSGVWNIGDWWLAK